MDQASAVASLWTCSRCEDGTIERSIFVGEADLCEDRDEPMGISSTLLRLPPGPRVSVNPRVRMDVHLTQLMIFGIGPLGSFACWSAALTGKSKLFLGNGPDESVFLMAMRLCS